MSEEYRQRVIGQHHIPVPVEGDCADFVMNCIFFARFSRSAKATKVRPHLLCLNNATPRITEPVKMGSIRIPIQTYGDFS